MERTILKITKTMLIARNVINIDTIKNELVAMAKDKGLNSISPGYKWFTKTLLTYLINDGKATKVNNIPKDSPQWLIDAYERNDKLYSLTLTARDKDKYNHILDYINEHPNENYSRIGYNDMENRIVEWDRKLKEQKDFGIVTEGIIPLVESGNYVWCELTTQKALKQEGNCMGHCVGGNQYWTRVKDKRIKIFSLRNKSLTESFVTIEYNIQGKNIKQIQGKGNTPPKKYRTNIIDFIQFYIKNIKVKRNDVLKDYGFFLDKNNKAIFVNLEDYFSTDTKIKINSLEILKYIVKNLPREDMDLNHFDVSEITSMTRLFLNTNFNGDISKWDVSNVEDMNWAFASSKFNGDISRWDVSNVKDMSLMFEDSLFNKDISKWNVKNVKSMHGMFMVSNFNGDISRWNVSNVEDMSLMFCRSLFNKDISRWDVSNVEDMSEMFLDSKFNGDILKWDVSNVTSMQDMFCLSKFNKDISKWNVSNVKSMSGMFRQSKFNKDISKWDIKNVKSMHSMFYKALFSQDLEKWNVKKTTMTAQMFMLSKAPIPSWYEYK